jgi:hypothetical protein
VASAIRFLSAGGAVRTDARPMRVDFLSARDIGTMGPMTASPGRMMPLSPWMASVAIAAVGCDAQVTPDYKGEPIDFFHGEIRSSLEHSISEVQVAIAWVTAERAEFDVVIPELPLEAGATRFDIALERAPSVKSLADCTLGGRRPDENHLGFGWITIALQGVLPEQPVPLARVTDLRRDGLILGFAEQNVVVWVDEEMHSDTHSTQILSGTFSPGPYLMEGRDSLRLAPSGRAVPIGLTSPENGFGVPYFPWRECTNVAPPAEATQSLKVDVSMTTMGFGPST